MVYEEHIVGLTYEIVLTASGGDTGKANFVNQNVGSSAVAGFLNAGIISADSSIATGITGTVIFNVSPGISESRSAEYWDTGQPGPVGVTVYKITQNRRFSIGGQFLSRTITEADTNYGYVNILRSWMVPEQSFRGKPPIIRLNGYQKQFNNIPVVLAELSINYPDDVDYIEGTEAMVPILQKVDLTLIECHAVTEKASKGGSLGDFNLEEFKQGILPGY